MASQPAGLAKLSNSQQIQILPCVGSKVPRAIQLLNANLSMQTSGGSLLADRSSGATRATIEPAGGQAVVGDAGKSTSIANSTVLPVQWQTVRPQNSFIQVQVAQNPRICATATATTQGESKMDVERTIKYIDLDKLDQSGVKTLNNAVLKKCEQTGGSLLKGKLQDGPLQLPASHIVQVPGANIGNQVQVQVQSGNNSTQVRSTPRSVQQVLYIQTPPGLKSTTENNGNTSASHPQIIVRRPIVGVASKITPVSKTPLAPKLASQSILIHKSNKLTTVPVSVSTGVSGRNALPTYVKSGKKLNPSSGQDNQLSLLTSTSHTTVPTTSSQKYVFAAMNLSNLSKVPNTKILVPMTGSVALPNTKSVINFQIGNGQIKGDPQGNITVMSEFNSLAGGVTDLPPLHSFNKTVTTPNDKTATSDPVIEKSNSEEAMSSVPGTKIDSISEQEYALSIPEPDGSASDDIFTVTLLDGGEANAATEKFAIPTLDKGKSLLGKGNPPSDSGVSQGLNLSTTTHGPAILRRSNSESNEKKANNARRRISLCADLMAENESNVDTKNKINIEKSLDIVKTTDELSKVSLLLCNEELDGEMESKVINHSTVNQPSRDRRKSRIHSDMHYTLEKNVKIEDNFHMNAKFENNITKQIKDVNIGIPSHLIDDAPGLQWINGVGMLNGSSLQFHFNEFGILDILEKPKNKPQLIKRTTFNGRGKKSTSPDDFYCCIECGCHGMSLEFITPEFCSKSCQINFEKTSKQKKDKQRKLRKLMMIKDSEKERSENDSALEVVEKSYEKHDLDIKLVTKKCIKTKNMQETNLLDVGEEFVQNQKTPWFCVKSGFSWSKYLEYTKAIPVPAKLFKEPSWKNNFKKGMKLEAIDPVHPSVFAICTITKIQGHRLRLHFDGYHEDFDFWVNSQSCDIFPPGWCEKTNRILRLPKGFDQKSFSWPLYIKQSKAIAAPKTLFTHIPENTCPNGFQIGMKLEAEDRKNSLTCVATVADVINNRILIRFDSWDDIYDYWVDPSSPYIHPVGWCDENGYSLTPPNSYKDPENFTWEQYLQDTFSVAVPARAFKMRPPHKYKVGMKLEAVDKRAPFLIRVATISDIRKHQIRISFDGWPDELSYWVDDDCPDIHPVGWCLKTGHFLEPPLTKEDLQRVGECGTLGCHGFGNLCSAKLTTHCVAVECPYRLPPASPEFRDRLDGTRPPAQLSEPRPREPRKVTHDKIKLDKTDETENQLEEESVSYDVHAPKRKLSDVIKTEVVSDEESSCQSKKKREASPLTEEEIKNSVLNPGYLPNPNKLGPIGSSEFFPLSDILQKESLRVDPRNWNQNEVQRFIQNVVSCGEFSWKFSKHRIDGESLLMLSQEDLVSVIGMKLGPAIKVYNSIIQLRQKILS